MKLSVLLKIFSSLSSKFIKMGFKNLIRKLQYIFQRANDFFRDTRIQNTISIVSRHYIDIKNLQLPEGVPEIAEYLIKMYVSHRYDLLGSGWVNVGYNAEPLGVENHKYEMNKMFNLKSLLLKPHYQSSKYIFDKVEEDYMPIDWQKDFKSGYRYSQKKWYRDHKPGTKIGADIKVPWEIARLQHLPQLAIFAYGVSNQRNRCLSEFKNQVLDFIASNPPRMGVNWACTMDVAIRVANMLIAYDLFRQMDTGGILDEDFDKILSSSVYEHGLHIVNNFEWNSKVTSNHYLSNIVGLLFIASYLERTTETDTWLAFAVQELVAECKKQFYEDGGNFESSTSYHRLSCELLLYASALILGLTAEKKEALKNYNPQNWKLYPYLYPLYEQEWSVDSDFFFPKWYYEKLYRAGMLTYYLTKPTSEVPQIGDNDSGRFLKFSPNGKFLTNRDIEQKYLNLSGYTSKYSTDELFWDEDILNHQTLLSGMAGLFQTIEFNKSAEEFPLEKRVIELFLHKKKIAVEPFWKKLRALDFDFVKTDCLLPYYKETTIVPKRFTNISLTNNLQLFQYPDSGIYIFQSDRIHLTVCLTPVGQNGLGGHTHNDKGSFELNIDDEDLYVDPGTYIYTALPKKRNEFRSSYAHNVIMANNIEQNMWKQGLSGLFEIKNDSICEVILLNTKIIVLKVAYKNVISQRRIEIFPDKIIVADYCNKEFISISSVFSPYSNGYGKNIGKKI